MDDMDRYVKATIVTCCIMFFIMAIILTEGLILIPAGIFAVCWALME